MLNKLVLRALLSLSLTFSFAGGANAALITQDILDNGAVIGNVTVDSGEASLWEGNEFLVEDFVSFNLFGFDLVNDVPYFEAYFNNNDLASGLLSLDFSVSDTNDLYSFAGTIWDSSYWADPSVNENFVDVWSQSTGEPALFSFDVTLGDVSAVPTPATFVLFLTAVAGLVARRKTF